MLYPLKINPTDFFVVGAEYNEFDIEFGEPAPFVTDMLEQLQIIHFNLGYIAKWNENWHLVGILTQRVASNLTGGVQMTYSLMSRHHIVKRPKMRKSPIVLLWALVQQYNGPAHTIALGELLPKVSPQMVLYLGNTQNKF